MSAKQAYIEDVAKALGEYEGQEINIRGWIYNKRFGDIFDVRLFGRQRAKQWLHDSPSHGGRAGVRKQNLGTPRLGRLDPVLGGPRGSCVDGRARGAQAHAGA